jgi:hypothetical protein
VPVWSWWVIWGTASLGSIYFFALVIYRLALNARSLQGELTKTTELIGQLEQLPLAEVAEATAATADDLVRLTALRNSQKRKKTLRREQRQRRLIEHLKNAEETP